MKFKNCYIGLLVKSKRNSLVKWYEVIDRCEETQTVTVQSLTEDGEPDSLLPYEGVKPDKLKPYFASKITPKTLLEANRMHYPEATPITHQEMAIAINELEYPLQRIAGARWMVSCIASESTDLLFYRLELKSVKRTTYGCRYGLQGHEYMSNFPD